VTEEENAGIGVLNALLALPARERGRRFEHLCKWFLENDPVYRDRMRHVWLWKDWPGRWGIEAGIDLVAETITGTLWAVQAKAYSPRHTITKDGVHTFLSESARGAFSHRLLIATTNRIGATARRTINGQEKPVSTLTLSRLQASSVRWPETVEGFGPQAVPELLKRPRIYVQQQLGHHSAAFTLRVYGHLLPRGDRRAVDTLDDATIRNLASRNRHARPPAVVLLFQLLPPLPRQRDG
jgi:predicted helicase